MTDVRASPIKPDPGTRALRRGSRPAGLSSRADPPFAHVGYRLHVRAASAAAQAAVAAQAGTGPIPIPALNGDPVAAATKLSQLGLAPTPVKRLANVPVGQVPGTIPAAGAKVAKGATVDLLISSGSPELSYDDGQHVHVRLLHDEGG
jgi:hypothetical protein